MPGHPSSLVRLLVIFSFYFFSKDVFARQEELAKIAKLVIELEGNTQWGAVSEAWKMGRNSWIQNLQKSPATVAKGLLQFEGNLLIKAMEPAWVQRKAAWRLACDETAQQPEKLVNLLLELESNLLWASVLDTWALRRDGWVSECNEIAKASVQASLISPTSSTITAGSLKTTSVENQPAYCTELQSLLREVNTIGLKTWAATGKTTSLWGNNSKPLKPISGITPNISFSIATQNGASGNILQTNYQKYKQQLFTCLQGFSHYSITLYTDLVNGNHEVWEKDGQKISLMFIIDSDINATHYLYLQVYEKKK
jgi:hypothetical protein